MALDQSYSSYEVIVVDQTSQTDSRVRMYLESVRDKIQYLRLPTPNLPAARNAGILASKGDVVVFIDDDVKIQSDYIGMHARHYADPAVGGVMGAIIECFASLSQTDVQSDAHSGARPSHTVQTAAWLLGGNTSYRREAILKVGLCDERFGGTGWCEDADLSVRVRHAGYKLLSDSAIQLVHLALPSGGCANRDIAEPEVKRSEHSRLYLFFVLKNRKILGFREVSRHLFRIYRNMVLNRRVLRRGLKETVRQHVLFCSSIIRARQRAKSEPCIAGACSDTNLSS
jgi:GT2 family glycosyltransferase